jgi:hypothetical protein
MRCYRVLTLFFLNVLTLAAFAAPQFSVTFSRERSSQPLDGRLLLILSTDASAEPRMQINDTPATQIVFDRTEKR